jgi:uncharacterized membrane protein YqaE (UPF0057 family)
MRYLLAILLPPLAVLICGKPVQALANVVLTVFFWVPGMIHAILVVNGYYEDRRTDRVVRAIERGRPVVLAR